MNMCAEGASETTLIQIQCKGRDHSPVAPNQGEWTKKLHVVLSHSTYFLFAQNDAKDNEILFYFNPPDSTAYNMEYKVTNM